MRRALLLLVLAACGDDSSASSDAADGPADAAVDAETEIAAACSGWGDRGELALPIDVVNAAALDADGAMVLAGTSDMHGALLRLLPDGMPDPAFGTAGIVMVPGTTGVSELHVRSAGGYVLVGGDATHVEVRTVDPQATSMRRRRVRSYRSRLRLVKFTRSPGSSWCDAVA